MSRRKPDEVLSAAAEERVEHYKALLCNIEPDTYTLRQLANCLDLEPVADVDRELRIAVRRLVIAGRATEDRSAGTFELLPIADQPDEEPDAEASEELEVLPPVGIISSPTRYLRHTLTASEREELRVEREEEDARIEQLSADLESLKKQAKHTANEIEILASKGLEKSKIIRLGWRMQDVPCEERRELDTREDVSTKGTLMMVTYRLDTFEPIEWRPLTYAERQGSLFDEAPAKTHSNGVEVRSNGATKGDVVAVANLLEGGL